MDSLKLTQPMMHGPAVRRLQELTDLLGIDLGPNDGIFGTDTEAEVLAFQRHGGLKADGVCGPITWAAIRAAVDLGGVTLEVDGIADIRGKHPHPKLYKKRRAADTVVGVTLHQTGWGMPRSAMGWQRLNAHIGVTQEGLAILVNDPLDWIWHAQGLSRHTIGIEIEGNYPGLQGNMRTLWRGGGGPHELNPAMMTSIDTVFDWLLDWFEVQGAEWQTVNGHRQSKDTRIADPGEEIWHAVGLPWREAISAVDDGPLFCRGSGRPLPEAWTLDGSEIDYNCRG